MAQSKTDPKRKQKLQKYKDSLKTKTKKMAESKPLPQIQQRPYWSSSEDIVVKGFEYEALVNLVNIFREGVQAADSSLQRNIQSGKIKVKYFDENNQELSSEQVEEITKIYSSYMQELANRQAKVQEGQTDGEATKSLLVSAEGEPLTSESPLRVV